MFNGKVLLIHYNTQAVNIPKHLKYLARKWCDVGDDLINAKSHKYIL